MHTGDALSRLQSIAGMPNNKYVIPLNFLQHLTPNYIEHAYSHLVENFYVHNTKILDTTLVKKMWETTQSKARKSEFKHEVCNSCNYSCYTIL